MIANESNDTETNHCALEFNVIDVILQFLSWSEIQFLSWV